MEHKLREADLSSRLLQVQDEERRHIGRELHDSVGQSLAAVGLNTAAVLRESQNLSAGTARRVEENALIIQQLLSEIRTMSYLLHPPLLDEMGLASALKEYVNGFAERSCVSVTLDLPEKLERLPQACELSLFRIVQECLTNVHRHSGSKTALVRLSRTEEQIELEVADQGRGMDPETQQNFIAGKSTGVGLRGMRERVRQLGGFLEIESDAGTTVRAVLPVERLRNAVA
jgi:two-component system, NarL family, sensor kinase